MTAPRLVPAMGGPRPETDTPGRRLHRTGMVTRGYATEAEGRRAHDRAWLDPDNAELRARYKAWAAAFLAGEAARSGGAGEAA